MTDKKSFTAKQLSVSFFTPVAKWKRWAREFLGIDPAAGRHAGVPREFDLGQAFHIYLGKILVGDLLFSIPDARDTISILKPFIEKWGYWPGFENQRDTEIEDHDLVLQPSTLKGPDGNVYQGSNVFRYKEILLYEPRTTITQGSYWVEHYKPGFIEKVPGALDLPGITWEFPAITYNISLDWVRKQFDEGLDDMG